MVKKTKKPKRPSRRKRPRSVQPVVAVVNTNDDLVLALRSRLLDEGYSIVTMHIREIKSGRSDFGKFLDAHDPVAVIYDIAIPYDDNWTFFQTLRKLPESQRRQFIVTTVNKRVMDQLVGPTDVIELQGGHADDFDPVIDAVNAVVRIPRSSA
jgi:hypothetical protein